MNSVLNNTDDGKVGKLQKYFSRKSLRRRIKKERIPLGVRTKIYAYFEMPQILCKIAILS